jgi:hypothetical protein
MDRRQSPEAPWRSGLKGARANLLPGVLLQLAALTLVLCYYYVPYIHGALLRLVEVRQNTGFSFGIVSTALFGGVLPFLYIHYSHRVGQGYPRYSWIQGLGLTAFWAYKGLEVDLWYRLQAHMFGSGHSAGTIALKVILDQFVYCPILAVPVTVAVYQAVEARYRWSEPIADLRTRGWYRRRALPVLISNLGVWVPAVAVIYCLPTPLQLPLQNIVLCFFTLVVAHQIRTVPSPIPAPLGSEAAAGLGPTL